MLFIEKKKENYGELFFESERKKIIYTFLFIIQRAKLSMRENSHAFLETQRLDAQEKIIIIIECLIK